MIKKSFWKKKVSTPNIVIGGFVLLFFLVLIQFNISMNIVSESEYQARLNNQRIEKNNYLLKRYMSLTTDYNISLDEVDGFFGDDNYYNEVMIVIFPKYYNYERLKEISDHEIGHFFYYVKLNRTEREIWNITSNSSIDYVTQYAKTNVREDFAESFMFWVDNKLTIPAKLEFMEKYVRRFE